MVFNLFILVDIPISAGVEFELGGLNHGPFEDAKAGISLITIKGLFLIR